MLIGRVQITKNDSEHVNTWKTSAYAHMRTFVCDNTLRDLFDYPRKLTTAWLALYDTPSPQRYHIKIENKMFFGGSQLQFYIKVGETWQRTVVYESLIDMVRAAAATRRLGRSMYVQMEFEGSDG